MFYNTPFFGFPNFYMPPCYKNSNLHSTNQTKKTSSNSFNSKESEEVKTACSSENNFFNFLGLNLQSDDILILGLLFFLYKEGCDDTYLYIALFLLLFS